MTVEVRTIDYVEKYVETMDDRRWPISDLFDSGGLKTLNPKDAVLCVAGEPGGWITLRLLDFDRRRLQ